MSAKLVIHAEIETVQDLIETNSLFLQKSVGNPYDLELFDAYITGLAQGRTPKIDQPKTTEVKENG